MNSNEFLLEIQLCILFGEIEKFSILFKRNAKFCRWIKITETKTVVSAESSSRICVRVIFKITSIVFLGHRSNENFKMLNVRNVCCPRDEIT